MQNGGDIAADSYGSEKAPKNERVPAASEFQLLLRL